MMARAAALAIVLLGCGSDTAEAPLPDKPTDGASDTGLDEFPDGWWADGGGGSTGEEGGGGGGEDGDEGDEGGDEGEEGAYWYGFFEDSTAEVVEGEIGWVEEGCEWYADLSGVAADPCPECALAFVISVGEPFTEEIDGCDEMFEYLTATGLSFTVGFTDDVALVQDDGAWEPFAEAFWEGDAVGWFDEF